MSISFDKIRQIIGEMGSSKDGTCSLFEHREYNCKAAERRASVSTQNNCECRLVLTLIAPLRWSVNKTKGVSYSQVWLPLVRPSDLKRHAHTHVLTASTPASGATGMVIRGTESHSPPLGHGGVGAAQPALVATRCRGRYRHLDMMTHKGECARRSATVLTAPLLFFFYRKYIYIT